MSRGISVMMIHCSLLHKTIEHYNMNDIDIEVQVYMCKHKEMNLCFEVRHDKVVLVPRTMKNGLVEVIPHNTLAFIRIHIGPMHEIRIKEANFLILE